MALGSPALLLVRSEGRRWGWGFVTFAQRGRPLPAAVASGRAAACDCGLSREIGPPRFLKHQPPEWCRKLEKLFRDKQESPLAHHGLVAAIIVTRREVPLPPPEKPVCVCVGGGNGAGRRSAQAQVAARLCAGAARNSAPELGRGERGCGTPAACAGAAVPGSRGFQGCLVASATWAVLPLAAAPPTSRLRPRRLELRNPLA